MKSITARLGKRGLMLILALTWVSLAAGVRADDVKLKPYVLAAEGSGNPADITAHTKSALKANGFKVIGEYTPYDNADVIVVTNKELKNQAARTELGGFGAIQRIAVTTVNGKTQVAYTNPVYMANAYRMKSDLEDVAKQLKAALGAQQAFGARGLTAEELRKYHYKIFMPYFDEVYELRKFASYGQAVKAVERGLAQHKGGTSQVYRVDVPGKQQSVFGVQLTKGCGADKFIMGKIDRGALRSTPHLPYELMVNGNQVISLHPKFRIAQSFPDLTMLGSGSFWDIKCAPDAIREAFYAVVGKPKDTAPAW
jgi:hypothetical protein